MYGVPDSIEKIEVYFPLFSSMETRGKCVMREGWDTTPDRDSYIETVQVCYSELDQCWLNCAGLIGPWPEVCRQAAGHPSQLISPCKAWTSSVIVFVVRVCVCMYVHPYAHESVS